MVRDRGRVRVRSGVRGRVTALLGYLGARLII